MDAMLSKDNNKIGVLVGIGAIQIPKAQPRRFFDEAKMRQLTESIKRHGILEPLIVRPLDSNKYELVAGERRYRAAIAAGLAEVPVTVHDLDEQQSREVALLENLQREDLNPIDETEGMLALLCQALNLSRQEIIQLMNRAANAKRREQPLTDNIKRQIECIDELFLTVGRTNRESFRTNRLPLLNLPPDMLEVLRQGRLEYTKVKAITKVEDEFYREQLTQQVLEQGLSLGKIKEIIKFPQDVFEVYAEGKLEYAKARSIAKVKEGSERELLIRQAIEQEFSLSDIEQEIGSIQKKQDKNQKQSQPQSTSSQPQLQDTKSTLQTRFTSLLITESSAWRDESKQAKFEALLEELQGLLEL